jgi:hypothetical protein
MRSLSRALALAALLISMAPGVVGTATAQAPTIEVVPERAGCMQPFEIRAAGLSPNQDVAVDITVAGKVTGSVEGRTDAVGQFFSPIPMILLPCADGGSVLASLIVAGEFVPITAQFEVARPVVALPSATPSPTVDASGATPLPPEAGTGAEAVSAPAAESALWVLIVIGTVATGGIITTWVTRPRDA